MAIPVTCSGCQAAFEVPDELVGKTIRCTTCGTQMTIGAAKKPFGWAAKSGETPAGLTPTVNAEPVPAAVRESAPAATAAAPAPAKAKPRKSVFDDPGEEDYGEYKDHDDEPPVKKGDAKKGDTAKKTTAAGSAATAAAGAKGGKPAAKKKGDAWKDAKDDEEDDDDYDAPKPKKKKKGGSDGPPVALIAGGVVGLLAIIGLAAWLLMGDSKKPDTASTSGSSGTSTPAASTPVMIVPAGTSPAGNPLANATWQPVKVGNFTCEMPGTPSQRVEVSPAGSVPLHMLEGPARDYAFFVTTVPLPASIPPNMVPKLLNDSANGAEQGMTRGGGFGGFGRANVIRVSAKTDVTQDGLPGKELQLAGQPGHETKGGVIRIVVAGREMFMFGAAGDHRGMLEPHIQRFMASVKIAKPSADPGGVAIGQPPKNPPGTNPFPQPPQPNPNPQPQPPVPNPNPPMPPIPPLNPGGEVVGNLKAKLNSTFLAGAFDTDKKELLVVCLRPVGGRPAGAVQRYSYPDFKLLATVNVPTAGTRAAVDSEKGLLYLATTLTNVNTLTQNQFDRNAYQGDVAVYDLAQLRSGKFDERTELKPLATVAVAKVIRDVSLSADGKSLYVLANTTVGKARSQVLQISTADRKVTKTLDLPTPGWDMVAAPDGQKLFVTGLATGANVPPLMVVDLAAMTLAPPVTLPKAAYHVAVAKDGRILTTTIPPAGGAGFGGPGGVFGGGGVPPVPGGGPGGPVNACELNAVNANGDKVEVLRPGLSGVSNSGYVGFSPDGKYLICSSHHPLAIALSGGVGAGVDVYETSDKFLGDKKVASMKKAGEASLGGTFLVSPDGEYLVFNNGAVLKLDDLGGGPGGIGAGGFPPPGGNPPGGGARVGGIGGGVPPVAFPVKD